MRLQSLTLLLAACGISSAYPHRGPEADDGTPTANVKNGTLLGVHSAQYNQDFFLGVPFAQAPVGNLRFARPQSLNESFPAAGRSATEYSDECVGYGGDQLPYTVNEDCLYLNVVRPAGYDDEKLPVMFWIHGGGFTMGGGPDRRYNLSFIVENSVEMGQPIVAVSTNYRLSAWGFLASNEIAGQGATNLGLRDQRKALEWVQENIDAFGGDAEKVTIFGESAGGASVGFHLTAFGGRDDKLFRGAILQSGNPVSYSALNGTGSFQPKYDAIVAGASCTDSLNTLQCLRDTPYETLNDLFNATYASAFGPSLDGDFIETYGSVAVDQGRFVRVPIIDGTNSDEGSSFAPRGINTTEQLAASLANYPPAVVDALLAAYPDDLSVNVIAMLGEQRPAAYPYGLQFRRAASISGDLVFIGGRRYTCEQWAAYDVPAYCYRFNAIPNQQAGDIGVSHFKEVAYVFSNFLGTGYGPPTGAPSPFEGKPQSHYDLSKLMSKSWVSFANHLDPNAWESRPGNVEQWPVYSLDEPKDFVFDANVTSYVEDDTYRAEGIRFFIDNAAGVFHR